MNTGKTKYKPPMPTVLVTGSCLHLSEGIPKFFYTIRRKSQRQGYRRLYLYGGISCSSFSGKELLATTIYDALLKGPTRAGKRDPGILQSYQSPQSKIQMQFRPDPVYLAVAPSLSLSKKSSRHNEFSFQVNRKKQARRDFSLLNLVFKPDLCPQSHRQNPSTDKGSITVNDLNGERVVGLPL